MHVNLATRWLLCGTIFLGMGLYTGCTSLAAEGPDVERPGANVKQNPHVWRPKTKSVAVFKNGLGFFMREGAVQLRDGWCVASEVPPAAFGTLAIYSHGPKNAVDIVGSGPGEIVEFDDRDAPADVESKRKRLTACRQLKIQLYYQHKGQERSAAGTLVSVGSEFVILEDETNNFAVPLDGVTKLQVLDLPLRIHLKGDAPDPVESASLGMAYLRKGITWIPEYTLEVIDDETAELTLRGTLVNAAEDLIHTDVHLVVGVPHFVHTDFMAPIAVGQTVRTIGAVVAAQQIPQQVASQIMNRAAIVRNSAPTPEAQVFERPIAAPAGELSGAIGDLPQLSGAAATDYTVYTKKDLTLRRGEKAILSLFTRKIRYSHTYSRNPPERMKHSLVLHNATDTAWTTGPCLALSDGRPLSEDMLNYTPKGSGGELPVTAAINIAHSKSERESARKLKAYEVTRDVFYDLVTLDGELTLHNYEKRAVDITITTIVAGKPVSASDNASMRTDPTKLKTDQREGSITWQIQLQPDQRKTITYQYERYVRSN